MVILSEKIKLQEHAHPLRAVSILLEKRMSHTAVSVTKASSVTLQIWQHGANDEAIKGLNV